MTLRNRHRTGDQALVRQINLSLVFHSLRRNAPISRAGLAELTGLNKTTVSSLIQELMDRRFIHEVGLESGSTGRPARLLTMNPGGGCMVSGEIGVDFISVICTNFAPEVIWRQQMQISPDMGQQVILDHVLALLNQGIEAGKDICGNTLGIALGIPGLVDHDSGKLLFAPNLKWRDLPLRDLVTREIEGLQVFVDNEANMGALGEHYFGAAQGCDEVLYISAGVGLGGGVIHSGMLYRGAAGFGSEFGHMTMDPIGERCGCGNRGCWETQVSQRALLRYVRENVNSRGYLPEKLGSDLKGLSVPLILEAAVAGDPVCIRALEKIGRDLGVGIAALINALNPELVVIGGILSVAAEYLFPAIRAELENRALKWNYQATKVVQSQHGVDSCVLGGVASIYHAILSAPDAVGISMR